MATGTVELSVVVPMYDEADALDLFFRALLPELERLGLPFEVVCVNDGSRDDTLAQLLERRRQDPRIVAVDLSRNFGKEAALTAGLDHARGRAVVPIDADLQDPPELLGALVAKWREGYEVVLAKRVDRSTDSFLKRLTAGLFYRLHNRLSTVELPANVGDFRLLDRRVVEALKQLPERQRFMKGLFAWVGFRTAAVEYSRRPRAAGATKFSFWKLWNFAVEGITGFSTVPLRVWTYLGAAVAAASFLYASVLIVRTIIHGRDVPGYASIVVISLFLGGLQLVGIGLLGEYVGRIYFESKQRPVYIVRDVYQ